MRNRIVSLALFGCLLAWVDGPGARAEELPEKHKKVVNKGLEWLAKQQHRDGHWEAPGAQYATAMTGMAGVAPLCGGSTIREGKYKDNIRRAADWLIGVYQPNGLIGDPNAQNGGLGYLYGHGFSMMFISQLYGEEEDADRRKKFEDMLTKGAAFSYSAQTSR